MKKIIASIIIAITATAAAADYELVSAERVGGTTVEMYADFDGMEVSGNTLFIPAMVEAGDIAMALDIAYTCRTGRPSGFELLGIYDRDSNEVIEAPRGFVEAFEKGLLSQPVSDDDMAGTKLACKILR